MKVKQFFLIIALMALVECVSATTNLTAYGAGTSQGPTGILISLGIETALPNAPLSQIYAYYNWISLLVIFMIGAMSTTATKRFFAILVPLMAALMVWFGWLHGTPSITDPTGVVQTWGIIVVCALLGVMIYMKDSLHEKFGIAGPGSLLFNIVFYIIIIQACVGFVNTTAIWEGGSQVTSNSFSNIDIGQQVTQIGGQGGASNPLLQTGQLLLDMTIGVIKMFITIAEALVGFSVILGMIYPWIPSSAYGPAFLILLQLGIYAVYFMAYMRFIKPTIGEMDF